MLLGAATAVLLLMFLSATLASRALELGRRDMQLVELVRTLETVTGLISTEADRYLLIAPRDYGDYFRDTKVYYVALRGHLDRVEDIRGQLSSIVADPADDRMGQLLAGDYGALRQSLSAFDGFWLEYRDGLAESLGPDPDQPRLEWGAKHLQFYGALLQRQVDDVSRAAQGLVDHHFRIGEWISQRGMLLAFALAAGVVFLLMRYLSRRVEVTLNGCRRIAAGDFGLQIPVRRDDELSSLDQAVNRMSSRMAAVLALLDRIQQSHDLGSTLEQVRLSLSQVESVDWLALYEADMDRSLVELRAQQPEQLPLPHLDAQDLQCPTSSAEIIHVGLAGGESEDRISRVLVRAGMRSAIWVVMPMSGNRCFGLLLASRQAHRFSGDSPELLRNVAPIIANGLDKTLLSERLLLATVNGLSKLAESRDTETGDHLLRISHYSRILAESYVLMNPRDEPGWQPGKSAEFIRDIHRFAPMHDIGKVGIPDAILLKPGKLDGIERGEMNMHPLIGGEVLRACAGQLPGRGLELFRVAIDIAEGHHEKYDGTGYPMGLAGKEISLAARIVAIADVFDALTSRRPYKKAWSPEKALETLRRESGGHFDPDLVVAFEAALPKVMAIYHEHRHV